MSKRLALIVDDEPDIRELLELTLARMGIDSQSAASVADAKAHLAASAFDICLTDMKLPDGNGIDLVRHIQQHCAQLPAAVITAHGNMESAVEALKAGAFDFVSKPLDLPVLRRLIDTALKLRHEGGAPAPSENGTGSAPLAALQLLGDSAAIRSTRTTIAKLARSQAPVYISGESGSGKELVARLIHEQGPRADQPFIPVNCGAIPEALMESEFFGHKKGSFTGATSDKPGLFQAANDGTLFLDEVADLPLHMQVKLLRAIQEKSIRPVGAQKELPIDVRILSATHKDLAALVQKGSFRQDLFYRINVIELHVPSLRQRPEDIPVLVAHILATLARQSGEDPAELSPEALETLLAYPFPGNVRELENILERAITLCENHLITATDLQLDQQRRGDAGADHAALPAAAAGSGLDPYLGDAEKTAILHALEKTRYNKTAAARMLGITFRALRYRLKKYNIQ